MVLKGFRCLRLFILISLVLLAAACGGNTPAPTEQPAVLTATLTVPQDTPTAIPPSPTPVPLAARVNGEEITLEEYHEELNRYNAAQASTGTNMATEGEQVVLEDLVKQVLLAQAAAQAGYQVDLGMVNERMEQLAQEIGGQQILASWMAENGYSEESLSRSLARAMASAWMRDQIIESVPTIADQVHVRQILLNDAETSQDVLSRLSTGRDFEDLAYQFDPLMGGDLGWLPKGYLAEEDLNDAAFTLEVGAISPVIETDLGFHILQVIEKAEQRPLSPDARLVLQEQALREWLDEHREQSSIELLIP